MSGAAPSSTSAIGPGSLAAIVMLVTLWGCNWPIVKLGVAQLEPLTYRAFTMPFAALAMMAIARASGDSLALPRRLWTKVAVLALLNISLWNVATIFGVQSLPAGRSAILGYTMPIWSVAFSLFLVHEPLSWRKGFALALGIAGMAMLLGEDIHHLERTPAAALTIVGGAASWGLGTVLLRKWRLALPQSTLAGWTMLLGFVPVAIAAPLFATVPLRMPDGVGLFAMFYSIFLAGALAHWVWFRLAQRVPVIVSSMCSLPVPVIGVFSGMLLLGERPGVSEWIALACVLVAVVTVLWQPRATPSATVTHDR